MDRIRRAVSFYYCAYPPRRRHPTPLISLSLFEHAHFPSVFAGNLAASGDGCVPFDDAVNATGWFWLRLDRRLHDAPAAFGFYYREIDRNAGFATFGIPEDFLVGITVFIGLMIA